MKRDVGDDQRRRYVTGSHCELKPGSGVGDIALTWVYPFVKVNKSTTSAHSSRASNATALKASMGIQLKEICILVAFILLVRLDSIPIGVVCVGEIQSFGAGLMFSRIKYVRWTAIDPPVNSHARAIAYSINKVDMRFVSALTYPTAQ